MRDRIVFDAEMRTPCIRSVGVPVAAVVDLIAKGYSPKQVVESMPGSSVEDVNAALWFAAAAVIRHCEGDCTGDGAKSHA